MNGSAITFGIFGIQLVILKHRNGPIATIDMLFKKKTSTFLSIKRDGGNNAK